MPPINGYRSTKSNAQEDDRSLIQQVGIGDRKAFGILYDRYKTLVFSLATKIAVSHETAEDITLEVFMQIWERADKYHPEKGSVKGWIASIARYRSIDTLRRRNVRQDINRPQWSDVQLEKLPSNDNPGAAFESAVTRYKVSDAINRLPKNQQDVLAMAYFKGYTHRQIAEALNEPLGTIKTRIRLGLQKLRQKLMQRIQSTAKMPSVVQPIVKRWKWRSLWQGLSPAWAFAGLVMIISLSVVNLIQWYNAQELQDEVAVELLVLKMKGTSRAPKGDGTFVISQDRKKGVLVASDLPIPDESQQYQLWMKKNGQQVSGGVFSVTPTGYAVVEIHSKESLSNFRSFEITLEPAGGSNLQTGHLYMVSHL